MATASQLDVPMQYIKFLQKYLSRDTYERLLPSLDALISGFGLDVEVAWQVYRHLTTHLEPDTSASPEDGEVDELEGSAPKDALAVAAPSTPPITDAPTHIEDAGRDARALTETERRMWQHWQADSGADEFTIRSPQHCLKNEQTLVQSVSSYAVGAPAWLFKHDANSVACTTGCSSMG